MLAYAAEAAVGREREEKEAVRVQLRAWENGFKEREKRAPRPRTDAPPEIFALYRRYRELKG